MRITAPRAGVAELVPYSTAVRAAVELEGGTLVFSHEPERQVAEVALPRDDAVR